MCRVRLLLDPRPFLSKQHGTFIVLVTMLSVVGEVVHWGYKEVPRPKDISFTFNHFATLSCCVCCELLFHPFRVVMACGQGHLCPN